MGWDQKDAVGESLQKGDRVKVFRYNDGWGHTIVGDYVGQIAEVRNIEYPGYHLRLQIQLVFEDGEVGWTHQSSVMKV